MLNSLLTTVVTPWKCLSPGGHLQGLHQRAAQAYLGTETGGIDLFGGRGEDEVGTGVGDQLQIRLLGARVRLQIARPVELSGLTKIETTTRSHSARARSISDR